MDDLVTACRILDGERLTDAFGHISTRLESDEMVISPKLGPGLVASDEDLIRTGPTGKVLAGDATLVPGEAALHRAIYRARADVGAVCRFHGSACMAYSTLGRPLPTTIGHGLVLGTAVPVFDSSRMIATDDEADLVAAELGSGSAILLRGFGAVTVGRTVAEATTLATVLERQAAAVLQASAIGEPLSYPEAVVQELLEHGPIIAGQTQRLWNFLRIRHTASRETASRPAQREDEPQRAIAATEDTIWLAMMGGGVQERYYDAGGVRTRVLEAGDGPPLVLLHGTGGHAETYCRNLLPLSGHYRVLAVDMVGHGFSDCPEIGYSLDDFAGHVGDLLDVLGIERAHISGESLGAAVAAWFAITRPERVDRLVLNTAVLKQPTEEGLAELEEFGRRTAEVMASGFNRDAVRKRMQWLVADAERMTEELVSCRHRIYSRPGMLETIGRVMMSVGGMFRGKSGQQYLEPGTMGRIGCPTLVLWTEHNPGQSADFAREASAEIPDHEFHVIPDCGHWPQFEQADIFNELLVGFLSRSDDRAAVASGR